MTKADLQELITRLEQAEGPSRELDGAIRHVCFQDFTYCDAETMCTCSAYPECSDGQGCGLPLGMSDERMSYPRNWRDDDRLPRYTASLDAAVALVERVLPPLDYCGDKPSEGWKFGVYRLSLPGQWTAWIRQHADGGVEAMSRAPALALCIALVRAMEAERQRADKKEGA